MILAKIDSDFLRYLLSDDHRSGDRLTLSGRNQQQTGMSMGKLREQFEVARMLVW